MGTKSKIKPVLGINSNAWYHVTEGRVDKAGKRFSNMLQVDSSTSGLIVSPNTTPPCYWQFQPFNDTSSEESSSAPRFFVLRNSRDGAAKQLSACRNETEPAPGQTGLCMAAADGADAAQVWQVDQWGGDMLKNGLRLINAANGTRFWLDVHKGNPPFMNGDTAKDDDDDDDDDDDVERSQKWYMTSAQAVNAVEYSTIHTISPTSTGSIAAAATTSDPRAMAGGSSSSSGSSSGGSVSIGSDGSISVSSGGGGGQVGIGIGVGLAIVALALFAFLLWRRCRRNEFTTTTTTTSNANKSLSPTDTESNLSELHCQPPDADTDDGHAHYNVGYHHPQELPIPAAAFQEMPTTTTVSQELPTPITALSQELPTPTTLSQELSTPATASQELPTPTTASQELYTPTAASSSPPQQVARETQAQHYELDCTPVSR
ncbi:transmembrane alpha-helix domain-containing protein [Beauveria brongniartii RCEF 3172]|uniref:Transmembrane alpha-helix domain-containing protein n=1 Tax=Beauveria brongniartii RCEF 3172 TaxID=1081107 RepID=A0A162J558_9HYPO|nr:transmembrane alpha-helix domain-containing protein [Beauveria brongniartii RCEF 3172]